MDKAKLSKLFNKHKMTPEQVEKDMKTNLKTGLTSVEARKRLEAEGPNELQAPEEKSLWERIAEQFDDVLVKILLASATISFIIALTGKFDVFQLSFLLSATLSSCHTISSMKFNLALSS